MRPATLAAVIAASLIIGVAAGAATTVRFSDVPEDHWASEAIEWVTDAGIMRARGDNGTVFEPDKPVTRAKLAQILWRLDLHYQNLANQNLANDMTIAQSDIFFDIIWRIDDDGNEWSTSLGFDETHTLYEVEVLVRDLCETMGSTPANATLAEVQDVIPNWIEATEWKKATDEDKWRVVFYGHWSLCNEYESVYDAWSDADWPPLDFD